MKVKADFKTLNESMQKQQKETDLEQDKQMNAIEEKVKAVQAALGESNSLEQNTEKLSAMQAEMVAMQEKFQEKMTQIETALETHSAPKAPEQTENAQTEQPSEQAADGIKAQLKTLEDRTKMGFAKVKTEFTVLQENFKQTQKETDEEQDRTLE